MNNVDDMATAAGAAEFSRVWGSQVGENCTDSCYEGLHSDCDWPRCSCECHQTAEPAVPLSEHMELGEFFGFIDRVLGPVPRE